MKGEVNVVGPDTATAGPSILPPALVGLLSLGLGVVAHAASGGVLPSAPILGGLAALSVLAATLVGRMRLPGWAVMVLLGVVQQILHWLLGGLGGAASSAVAGSSIHHDGAVVPTGEQPSTAHSPEVMLMLHLHLAAALLIGWAVVRYPALEGRLSRSRVHRPAPTARKGASVR